MTSARQRGTHRSLLSQFAWVALLLAGCASSSEHKARPAIADNDRLVMRKRALMAVPIGTSLVEARRIMEEQGFECRDGRDERTGDYLDCRYSEQDGIWVTWVWRIWFHLQDGTVKEVSCSYGGIGP